MTDFHVHSLLCDGKNTLSEMAKTAYDKGFTALGFSGHSYIDFDDYCMSKENTLIYKSEIDHLKAEYDGKMDVFCGIEQDYYSPLSTDGYDYVIGSVHSLTAEADTSVDLSAEATKKMVADRFDGDFNRLAEEYFRLEADVVRKTNCDIIGHFDLVTKFTEQLAITENKNYLDLAFSALNELLKHDRIFEINVGAITRGVRTLPYPSVSILKELCSKKGKIMINGDCHNKLFLGAYLEDAKKLALECGFKTHFIFTKDGFKEIKL